MLLALYEDDGVGPGNLIASTSMDWGYAGANCLPVTEPVWVEPGTYFMMGWFTGSPNANNLKIGVRPGAQRRFFQITQTFHPGAVPSLSGQNVSTSNSEYHWWPHFDCHTAESGFEGSMDEFGAWNKVLTPSEIEALYLSEDWSVSDFNIPFGHEVELEYNGNWTEGITSSKEKFKLQCTAM